MTISTVHRVFQTHPEPVDSNAAVTSECLEACVECALVCTACADACIAEGDPDMRFCIRLNLDCADICETTARILARASRTDAGMLRALVDACAAACKACGEECARHGEHVEHCAVCAEACRRCEEACRKMASAVVP